ncbi:MAG: glycosyltransferase [Sediminibacterium sp.]|nr:glycosyltransferase [Sediminibacterium sp.]
MIVVGYLYNNNGMASWCIETALALHNAGERVILVKSKKIVLPDSFPVKTVDFDISMMQSKRTLSVKVRDKLYKLWFFMPWVKPKTNFLETLHHYLNSLQISPFCYIFNQTNILCELVPVPQHVVAWTYQPYLQDYLRKALLLSKNFKQLFSNMLNAFYWHKVDWHGYKIAQTVMSVSNRLSAILLKEEINARCIYPCVRSITNNNVTNPRDTNVIRFALMALSLEDKRKGFIKVINILKQLKPYQFTLTLIGSCSDEFKEWVLQNNFPAIFTGILSRDYAIGALRNCDVLIFASISDDWGYVQVEAMSQGLAILSPQHSPFDEIIGREDYLYKLNSKNDLQNKLSAIIHKQSVDSDKTWFKNRYTDCFSSDVFSKNLIQLIGL